MLGTVRADDIHIQVGVRQRGSKQVVCGSRQSRYRFQLADDSRTWDDGRQESHSHINHTPRIHRKDRLSSRVLILRLLNIQRALIRAPKPIVSDIVDPDETRPAGQLAHPERRPFAGEVAAVPAVAASLLPCVHVRGADSEGERWGSEGREGGLGVADAGKGCEGGECVVHREVREK